MSRLTPPGWTREGAGDEDSAGGRINASVGPARVEAVSAPLPPNTPPWPDGVTPAWYLAGLARACPTCTAAPGAACRVSHGVMHAERSRLTDWREAARGIPAWVGARVWFDRLDGWWHGLAIGEHEDRDFLRCVHDDGGICGWTAADLVPDLSDPDTRAAYDRRLALARGTLSDIDKGVIFRRTFPFDVVKHPGLALDRCSWILIVGRGPGEVLDIDTDDPLLARAKAWPADQRV